MGAVIAVAGTLLGVIVTNSAQGKRAERSERTAVVERLRQERIAAYAEFARSVMEFRASQYRRWRRRNTEPSSERYEQVRSESHELRAQAWYALYRVRLVTDDERTLVDLGTTAMSLATQIDEAPDFEELKRIGSMTRTAVEAFIDAASPRVS